MAHAGATLATSVRSRSNVIEPTKSVNHVPGRGTPTAGAVQRLRVNSSSSRLGCPRACKAPLTATAMKTTSNDIDDTGFGYREQRGKLVVADSFAPERVSVTNSSERAARIAG